MPSATEHGGEYEAGMAAFGAGEYEQALVRLEPIAESDSPEGTLARFYVGQSHLRLGMERFGQGRYAAAADHFRRAASVNPVVGGLCRYLATCYIALNRNDLAAIEMTRAAEADPDDTETRVRLALVTWKDGKPDRAQGILREALAGRPEDPELLYQLATLLGADERYDDAIGLLATCLQHQPGHARAHVRIAQCLGVRGRAVEALEHLQQAQRLEPNDAMVAFQLSALSGQVCGRSRTDGFVFQPPIVLDIHDERAIDRLATIIRENPEFLEAFLSVPASGVDGDVFAALLAVVERAIEQCPEYADLRHRCSQILVRLGRIDEAVAQSEQALAINPRYVHALIQIAQLYQTTDRAVAGIIRLEQAIQLGANYADVHYLLGQMYQSRGYVDEARSAYGRALSLNGRFEAARNALASLVA